MVCFVQPKQSHPSVSQNVVISKKSGCKKRRPKTFWTKKAIGLKERPIELEQSPCELKKTVSVKRVVHTANYGPRVKCRLPPK